MIVNLSMQHGWPTQVSLSPGKDLGERNPTRCHAKDVWAQKLSFHFKRASCRAKFKLMSSPSSTVWLVHEHINEVPAVSNGRFANGRLLRANDKRWLVREHSPSGCDHSWCLFNTHASAARIGNFGWRAPAHSIVKPTRKQTTCQTMPDCCVCTLRL